MEKALLLSPFEAQRALTIPALPCATLIIGSEFCQNQLPPLLTLTRLAHKFPGVKLALATSLMTDNGLRRWEKLLRGLPRGLVREVIVNDWGLFPALKERGPFALSLGRLLTREFARMDPAWARAWLKDRAVTAAETDTPELAAAAKKLRLKTSRHRPLGFMAVTTFCPFEKHFSQLCGHTCEGRLLKLTNPHLQQPLYLGEKAYLSPLKRSSPQAGPAWREVWTLNFLQGGARARGQS